VVVRTRSEANELSRQQGLAVSASFLGVLAVSVGISCSIRVPVKPSTFKDNLASTRCRATHSQVPPNQISSIYIQIHSGASYGNSQ
jgi:hypothetical protein